MNFQQNNLFLLDVVVFCKGFMFILLYTDDNLCLFCLTLIINLEFVINYVNVDIDKY